MKSPRWSLPLFLVLFLAVPVLAEDFDASVTTDPLAANPTIPSQWSFSLRPYLFFAGLSGSVTIDPVTFPINSSFTKIVQRLKLGGFISFTAEKNRWGVNADLQYINLYGESSLVRDSSMDLKNVIGEIDLLFRPDVAPTLRFLAGVRVYSIRQSITLLGRGIPETNTTVVDPILGAYGSWMLHDRWYFELGGDIGGFGVSSEFTYQLVSLFRWGIDDTISIPFGYRVLGYQISKDNVWMNTRMGGMMLGLDIRF